MSRAPDTEILHEPQARRFVTRCDGHEAWVDYVEAGGVLTITHTRVPEAIGGRGIAGALMQAVFDHARVEGLKVRPECSYALAWLRRHPAYAGMQA